MNTTSLTKLHHQMVALLERAEKAESELAKLRAAPAAPAAVFLAHNNNSKLLFAVREEAERFAASCGPAAGVAVTEYAVIWSKSAQQQSAPDDIHELAYELGGTDSGEYHLEPEALDRIIAAEVRRLREENERQRFDILAMNQSLDLLREENERLRKDSGRYRRLREKCVTKEGRIRMQGIIWNMSSRKDLDAALDKMLDGE